MRHFWPLLLFIGIAVLVVFRPISEDVESPTTTATSQRIISLAPSITESLFALGLGDRVVAVSDYCDYPTQATTLPKVGGFMNPNLEAIVALKPDLVLLTHTQGRAIEQLNQLGITSLSLNNTSIDNIKLSLHTIGQHTGHQQQAQQLISHIDHTIDYVQTQTQGLTKPKVMVTIGHSIGSDKITTIYISGQHDFYNDLITLAGGQNVYVADTPKVPSLSTEGILSLNPDIIIDVFPEADDHSSDIEQVKQQWQNLKHLTAVQNQQVHIIEQSYATIPGPRIVLLLNDFARIIHPELDWTSQTHD